MHHDLTNLKMYNIQGCVYIYIHTTWKSIRTLIESLGVYKEINGNPKEANRSLNGNRRESNRILKEIGRNQKEFI